MDTKQIEYILAIAREKNMTRAAQTLYISQPTLSQALAKLEQEIGQPLFQREHSEMLPTQAGLDYIYTAKQVLELKHRLYHPRDCRYETSEHPLFFSPYHRRKSDQSVKKGMGQTAGYIYHHNTASRTISEFRDSISRRDSSGRSRLHTTGNSYRPGDKLKKRLCLSAKQSSSVCPGRSRNCIENICG